MLTHSSSRGQLLMPLLSRNTSYQEEEFRKKIMEYDPFKSPPDFKLVEMHGKACLVGKFESSAEPDLCPCCNNYVNKGNMDINCNDQDLEFLGCAYPLFFRMTIYFIIFILILFLFGGSLRILISNWNCETNCVRFFGLMVIMDQSNEKEQFNGMWYDLLTAVILMVAVIIIKPLIANNIQDFNLGFLDPAAYTIAMKNLPPNTKKEDIQKFFYPILKNDDKIEKINFVYSVDKYFAAFNQKINCITAINKIKLKLRDSFQDESSKPKLLKQLEYQEHQLKEQEEQLEKFSKECEVEGNSENFTGTAFVTFNSQKIIKPILSEWGNNTRRSLQNFLFGRCQSPYQDFKGNKLIITKAPTPTDILWDNQKFSFLRVYTNNSLMILVAIAILFSSFYLQYIIMKIAYPFRKNAGQDFGKRIQAYMMSLVVVIVNAILRLVVMYFTQLQKLDSQVRFNQSYINRYVVLLFFNSAFMPYLIHKRWDDDIQVSSNLLLQDITFLFLTNAFSEPLAKIFNVFWLHRKYMRYTIRKYEPRDCPYTQHEANYWQEGPTFNIANSYAFIARTLFLCTWYASVAPYGLLFSLVGLIFNYYVDKVLLLRYCSCPETQNEDIFTEVIAALPFLPIIYVCGVIQFQNRTKLEVNENLFVFFGQYFEYGLTSVAMFVSFIGYLLLNNLKKEQKDIFNLKFNIQYEEARDDFRTEYEKVNPITSFRANMEWTKALNKKRVNNIVGNQAAATLNRNTRLTNVGFNFGGVRTSTFLTRNSSIPQLPAFRQRIPEDHKTLPLTSSQTELQVFKFN